MVKSDFAWRFQPYSSHSSGAGPPHSKSSGRGARKAAGTERRLKQQFINIFHIFTPAFTCMPPSCKIRLWSCFFFFFADFLLIFPVARGWKHAPWRAEHLLRRWKALSSRPGVTRKLLSPVENDQGVRRLSGRSAGHTNVQTRVWIPTIHIEIQIGVKRAGNLSRQEGRKVDSSGTAIQNWEPRDSLYLNK